MASSFSSDGKLLVEKLNGLSLWFQALEKNGDLFYLFNKTKFLGVPVPSLFSPRVEAWERENSGHYEFFVCVRMWLIGLVISYWGTLNIMEVEDYG